MCKKLEFMCIKNQEIFQNDFLNLSQSQLDVIEFKKQPHNPGGIAVVYAPNGTGKTSLTTVLKNEVSSPELKFEAVYDNKKIIPESKAFHIIGDQISRNVIKGVTSDYLIGPDIKREYELKKKISDCFEDAFNQLNSIYKNSYKITKSSDYLLTILNNNYPEVFTFIKDIVNRQTKGKKIDRKKFIEFLKLNQKCKIQNDLEEEKKQFIVGNQKNIKQILDVNIQELSHDSSVQNIEKYEDAIKILEKYNDFNNCIICDSEINSVTLLQEKREKRKKIFNSLDNKTKELLQNVAMTPELETNDPFNMKSTVLNFISNGDTTFVKLISELEKYIDNIIKEMINELLNAFDSTDIISWWEEYTDLLSKQPKLDSEELLLIQEIISENIGRNIIIKRDDNSDHNFKLLLDDQSLLGLDRSEMHLSSGEQNFISLAFALLLARHSKQELVVLDDPISSFDSIYKNKIAYCIIKFLEKKQQIILTHNIDLIRLLHVQLKNCFNLYILNNVEDGKNGFVPVKKDEKEILINLSALIKLFQNENNVLSDIILDKRLFLMSMIPFMRGYIHIMKDPDDIYGKLSKLMHGYETGSLNITHVYEKLFDYKFESEEIISVTDILNLSISNLEIINSSKYPLLAETLKQTLIYYHIRMKVEHELVEIFNISHSNDKILLLSNIIFKAFKTNNDASQDEKDEMRYYKVFFTSRKTLLNEFNHFEGNMNIFQPAIDITEQALQKEIDEIQDKLKQLRKKYYKECK